MKSLYYYGPTTEQQPIWQQGLGSDSQALTQLDEGLPNVENSIFALRLQAIENEQLQALLAQGYTILLLSDLPSTEEGLTWFQQGIKGYINSYVQPQRLTMAINAIQNHNIWLGQNIMSQLIQNIKTPPEPNQSWRKNLTVREIETAEKVLQGLSNAEIANQMFISERTVKAHISHLLEKFSVKDRLALVLKIQRIERNETEITKG